MYKLFSADGVDETTLFYLEECPVCDGTILILKRDTQDGTNTFRKSGKKAKKLYEKLKTQIMFEYKDAKGAKQNWYHGRFTSKKAFRTSHDGYDAEEIEFCEPKVYAM